MGSKSKQRIANNAFVFMGILIGGSLILVYTLIFTYGFLINGSATSYFPWDFASKVSSGGTAFEVIGAGLGISLFISALGASYFFYELGLTKETVLKIVHNNETMEVPRDLTQDEKDAIIQVGIEERGLVSEPYNLKTLNKLDYDFLKQLANTCVKILADRKAKGVIMEAPAPAINETVQPEPSAKPTAKSKKSFGDFMKSGKNEQ